MEYLDKDKEQRYKKYKQEIPHFTLMHDILMRCVFKDKSCVEFVLRVIMAMPELTVIENTIQADYKNLWGRSCILDCVVKDSTGRVINVEIQQDTEGASPKRARYHSGLLDLFALAKSQEFDELPETHVIFITRRDVLGYGKPIYHIERKIAENGEFFGDQAHITYVTANHHSDDDLGRLMHDFLCTRADDMYSPVLADEVRHYKETDEGVDVMCSEMDQLVREGEERGVERGIELGELKRAKESALNFYRMGLPVEQIAIGVNADVELVKEWISENT